MYDVLTARPIRGNTPAIPFDLRGDTEDVKEHFELLYPRRAFLLAPCHESIRSDLTPCFGHAAKEGTPFQIDLSTSIGEHLGKGRGWEVAQVERAQIFIKCHRKPHNVVAVPSLVHLNN